MNEAWSGTMQAITDGNEQSEDTVDLPQPVIDPELKTANCPAEDFPQPTIGCALPMANSLEELQPEGIVELALLCSGVPTYRDIRNEQLL